MPRRSKHEAALRMSIGMARVLMAEGKSAQEGLEAFKAHFENLDELERLQPQQDDADTGAVRIRKTP